MQTAEETARSALEGKTESTDCLSINQVLQYLSISPQLSQRLCLRYTG